MSAKAQSDALLAAITSFSIQGGEQTVRTFEANSQLVLTWLDYLSSTVSKGVCDELLVACKASLIEAAACLSLGLVRPAIFALRLEYELFLAWLFFNDHAVEWASTLRGESDFPMRKQNLSYLEKHNPRFKDRFARLSAKGTRVKKDPYDVLSKFVHGSSVGAMPNFNALVKVVQDQQAVASCQSLQKDVSEFLSDVAASWFADKWHDLPQSNRTDVTQRVGSSQLKDFCR